MSHGFKTPGILRAAFFYQDLIGIDVLLRMFRDPSRYAWVKLEADDGQFKAVDDIVARRSDGSFEVLQVKFTPDPSKPAVALDWSWLLERASVASRSLLEKWAVTTADLGKAGRLASAGLRTDRKPDAVFASGLAGEVVDYDLVPAAIRTEIEAQLGDEAIAREFFGRFAFWHSEDQLADLEYRLKAQVVPSDTDEAGWLAFINAVWVWATLKDRPRGGGEIIYQDLVQYITRQASKPIPQDFRIPDGYEVPDKDFHKNFVRTVSENDGVTVLWGTPGRGKSTYLSFCGDQRRRKTEVWVRHHYFLNTTDTTTARFYFHEIAQSLIAQIQAAVPEATGPSGDLRGWIAKAGAHLGAQGGRLVVVIDGLDHVWRERRSLEQMAQLFNNLLPLSPFVSLVVGTQKVPDEHLPARLLEILPKNRWTQLPLMSVDAIRSWLTAQRKAGRLHLSGQPWESDKARFSAVATAFYRVSQGLPLHLIYSFEALVRRGGAISADDIKGLPICPDGDIRSYYRTLWASIGARAREILHVLAGVQFAIPGPSLWEIFGRTALEASAIDQIDHLLERRPTGVLPFHGSVFAFVREISDHGTVFRAHGARIVEWLEAEAPPYWRWAWLWVTRTQLGEPRDLLRGPTRKWAIDGMASGYGLEQIKTILEQAESVAFEAMDLPRLFELRSLYTRASNAPEFQMRDMNSFTEVASALSSDDYPRLLLHDKLTGLAPGLMLTTLRSLKGAEQAAAAREVLKELNRRIQRQEAEEHRISSQEDWRRELIRTAALAETIPIDRVVRYARQYDDGGDMLMTEYARECLHAGRASAVIAAGKIFEGRAFSRELAAALSFDGITASTVGLPKVRGASPLLRSWCRLKGAAFGENARTLDVAKVLGPPERYETYHNGTRVALHHVFFTAFASALDTPVQPLKLRLPKEVSGTWFERLFNELTALAAAMAEAWTLHGLAPSMVALFAGVTTERPFTQSYGASREMIDARLGLFDIAFDLQVFAVGLDPTDLVGVADIEEASASPWWLDELWLQLFVDRRLRLHSAEGAEVFVARIRHHLDVTITEFADRAETATKLSLFAYDNGLAILARAELTRTADCALGYGWRKDSFAFEVLMALEHLLTAGSAAVPLMVLEIAAVFDAVTDYTDGDGTNHARSEYYALLARVFPDRGVACYQTLLEREEWHYADELLQAFAEILPDDRGRTALLRTFIQAEEFDAISSLSDGGRDANVIPYLNQLNGQPETTRKLKKERGSDSGPRRKRHRPLDVSTYPADQLTALIAAARKRGPANDDEGATVGRWLTHWEAQGQGVTALQDLDDFIAQGHSIGMFDRTFDLAFEISLRLQGRSKAFNWAVLAHRHRHGWQRYYTSEQDTLERLDRVAREFPTRWQDFIIATSEPAWTTPGERGSRVIGMERLVYFLLATGHLALAEAYVRSMIKVLLEEVSNQPLVPPRWAA